MIWGKQRTEAEMIARAEAMRDAQMEVRVDSVLTAGSHALSLRFDGRRISQLAPSSYEVRDLFIYQELYDDTEAIDKQRETLMKNGLRIGAIDPAKFEPAGKR